LVDNAVEAVGGTGNVDVEVVTVGDAGGIRLIVSDDGPGISAEDKDKLFLPYFSTKTNGMGLGLPIVHEIVAEHGGTIRVEDNLPRGTRFILDLPVSRSATPVEA
jgi:signal transduction histidine kinase